MVKEVELARVKLELSKAKETIAELEEQNKEKYDRIIQLQAVGYYLQSHSKASGLNSKRRSHSEEHSTPRFGLKENWLERKSATNSSKNSKRWSNSPRRTRP